MDLLSIAAAPAATGIEPSLHAADRFLTVPISLVMWAIWASGTLSPAGDATSRLPIAAGSDRTSGGKRTTRSKRMNPSRTYVAVVPTIVD